MKIQIRKSSHSAGSDRVKVREKTAYQCSDCMNRYYSYHYLCPQCLGSVSGSLKHQSILQIVSRPTKYQESVDLFRKLSGVETFDFEKALRSLPWNCMLESDVAILEHWKACLEAEQFRAEILPQPPPAGKSRRKPHPPLFESNAPAPLYLPQMIRGSARKMVQEMTSVSERMQLVDLVLLASRILEDLYKHPTGRVLFVDLIFQIEEQLREFIADGASYLRRQSGAHNRIEELQSSLVQMQSEIDAVRQQVRDQL